MSKAPLVHPIAYLRLPEVPTCIGATHRDRNNGKSALIIVGDVQGTISFWCLKSLKCVHTLKLRSESPILWIALCQDLILVKDKMGSLYCMDHSLTYQNIRLEKLNLENYTPHFGYCRGSVLETDGLIALPDNTNNVLVFKVDSSKQCHIWAKLEGTSVNENVGMICSLLVKKIDTNPLVLAGYEDGTIALWDHTKNVVLSKTSIMSDSILSIDYDPTINVGASTDPKGFLATFSLKNYENLEEIVVKEISEQGSSHLRIREMDPKIIAVGCWDTTIRLFSLKNPGKLKSLGALKFHEKSIEMIEFVENEGKLILVAASKDKKLSLWDVYNS